MTTVTYPLDPTGTDPANLVQGEVHSISPGLKVQAIAVDAGAFYADSLVVLHNGSQRVLTKDVEYYAAELYEVPSAKYAKDVCSIVILKTPTLAGEVLLTYQAVGGGYSTKATAVVNVLNTIGVNARADNWPFVLPNPADLPPMQRLFDAETNDRYGFEYCTLALDRLHLVKEQGDVVAREALWAYLTAMDLRITQELIEMVRLRIGVALVRHRNHPNPHPQYFLRADLGDASKVRQPTNVSPINAAVGQALNETLTGNIYGGVYRVPQQAAQFQVATSSNFDLNTVMDVTVHAAVQSYTIVDQLAPNIQYWWRVRYQTVEGAWSMWSQATTFTTINAGIVPPAFTAPANNAVDIGDIPTLTTNAFSVVGGVDTHDSTDWEVWTGPGGTGVLVWSSEADTINKTSIALPPGRLLVSTRYYPRARYRGPLLGASAWSGVVSFTTMAAFGPTVIGQAYGGGYYAGNINVAGNVYAILLAPKGTGETSSIAWADDRALEDTWYSDSDSVPNTAALIRQGSPVALWADALNIGGFTDWQVPSRGALEIIYRNAKPFTNANVTNTGTNAAAVPPTGNYTAGVPAQSTAAVFQSGGAQALELATYWSSTGVAQYSQTVTVPNPDTPIYGPSTAANPHSKETDSGYSDAPTCSDTPDSTGPSDVTNQAIDFGGGDMHYFVNWNCPVTTTVITGYTPGGTSDVTTDYYPAYARSMSDGAETSPERDTTAYARAIRLVRLS